MYTVYLLVYFCSITLAFQLAFRYSLINKINKPTDKCVEFFLSLVSLLLRESKLHLFLRTINFSKEIINSLSFFFERLTEEFK